MEVIASTHSVASTFLPASASQSQASQSQASQSQLTISRDYKAAVPGKDASPCSKLHCKCRGVTPQGRERKKSICQKLWHEETTMVLQLSLYMGVLAILKDYVMVFQLLVPFLASVRKAYITTAVQKKLPLDSPTLIALSALDPLLQGHSQAISQLKRLSAMLSHLLLEDQDLPRELVQFSVDQILPRYKEGDGIVEWWGHVFDKPGKYPVLSALAKCGFSIFHGPRVESSFSLMNEVIDQHSGNMNVETFNAIRTVKYTLRSKGQTAMQMFQRSDVKFWEVDRIMCQNINNAAAKYKQKLKAKATERQLQHRKYGCQETGSAQQARLRHVATQRGPWRLWRARQKEKRKSDQLDLVLDLLELHVLFSSLAGHTLI
ncbi:hypothetical protein ROHU_023414 [Xyrichtys novacula]|uniref:HAT C-terminal dimerisation domain-containing protein n=1 Tax=Xyrichtys novacula TaxID=13765 RepID=A0AAV1FJU3_XYRNO|nr:hypothetical protein ROHU_023414 [Xyrichtys novacula]